MQLNSLTSCHICRGKSCTLNRQHLRSRASEKSNSSHIPLPGETSILVLPPTRFPIVPWQIVDPWAGDTDRIAGSSISLCRRHSSYPSHFRRMQRERHVSCRGGRSRCRLDHVRNAVLGHVRRRPGSRLSSRSQLRKIDVLVTLPEQTVGVDSLRHMVSLDKIRTQLQAQRRNNIPLSLANGRKLAAGTLSLHSLCRPLPHLEQGQPG